MTWSRSLRALTKAVRNELPREHFGRLSRVAAFAVAVAVCLAIDIALWATSPFHRADPPDDIVP